MNHPARNRFNWDSLAEQGTIPVLLIRHGQTSWNKQKKFLGRTDIDLDAEGTRQAALAAEALAPIPFSALYSSPLARAWSTATAIAASRDTPIQPVPQLTELNQGELEGKSGSALTEHYPAFFEQWKKDPTHARVPGGETLAECHTRASTALHSILSNHQPGPPVAIVSHRMTIGCLICEAIGLPLRFNLMIGQRNTAVNLLGYRDGTLSLHHLNDATHLDIRNPQG
jgi:alpha-ribazole phosphatase/probable phosphoglycerate mutase